jgi:hypothetical protein
MWRVQQRALVAEGHEERMQEFSLAGHNRYFGPKGPEASSQTL